MKIQFLICEWIMIVPISLGCCGSSQGVQVKIYYSGMVNALNMIILVNTVNNKCFFFLNMGICSKRSWVTQISDLYQTGPCYYSGRKKKRKMDLGGNIVNSVLNLKHTSKLFVIKNICLFMLTFTRVQVCILKLKQKFMMSMGDNLTRKMKWAPLSFRLLEKEL